MNEQELRIGNLLIDAKERICTVDSISKEDGFKASAIKGAITSFLVAPIPLTEEWLGKVGLEWSKAYDVIDRWNKGHFSICGIYDSETGLYECAASFFENEITVEIKYVHQLQNLYYALTGEELKISEKV